MQLVLGPRHGDVEQPPLLLDLGRRAGAEIGRDAAVDDIEHEDRLPFLPLGGMDGGEDQIILVEQRHAGLVAGRVRRVERQFGQEALARRIAGRDLLELQKIGLARRRRLRACGRDAARTSGAPARAPPASPASPARSCRNALDERRPVVAGARRRRQACRAAPQSDRRRSAMASSTRCAECRPDAGQQLHQAEAGDAVARVFARSAAAPARP